MSRARVLGVLLALAVVARGAQAQTAADLLAQGARAYQGLELEAAAGFLRQALATGRADTLPAAERAQALMYLFAAETLLERREAALAAAVQLFQLDPHHRPEALVFPPEIVTALGEARRRTRVVVASMNAASEVRPGALLPITLLATTPHEVAAAIVRDDGAPHRTLYNGQVMEQLELSWDGLDSAGALTPPGRYALAVTSLDDRGRAVRTMRLPLTVAAGDDAGANNVASGRRSGPGLRALVSGVLIGAAVALLPGLIASGEETSGAQFVVGGAVAAGGIVAYLRQRADGPPATAPGPQPYRRLVVRAGNPVFTVASRP